MAVFRNKSRMQPPSFLPIGVINTTAATSTDEMYENIKYNIVKGYTRFHELPEFQKIKNINDPISIVGGGPSLKYKKVQEELVKLSKLGPVIAAGSSHDWLIRFGIHPDYTVICDPDPITGEYIKENNNNPNSKYLLASCVSPLVYAKIPKNKIAMWHCHSDSVYERMKKDKLEKQYNGVGGGCTVGLRSISIAIMLGYSDIHFFGFDSCMYTKDEHHAYDFQDEDKEFIGQLFTIKLGVNKEEEPYYDGPSGPIEKEYLCAGYQLAQVANFKEYYLAHRNIFNPTFHGDGLLKDQLEILRKLERSSVSMERAANE